MRGQHFAVLAAAAVVALIAVFWANTVREPSAPLEQIGGPLLPGLEAALNDVDEIRLTGASGPVATLKRGATRWELVERRGYPADPIRVRKLLIDLANAKLIEEKTSNPAFYERLGLDDVDNEDARGLRIEIAGLDEPLGLLVGDRVAAREGSYVRRDDEEQTWLADFELAFGKELLDWVNKEVINIEPARIAEVRIDHADGTNLIVRKSDAAQRVFEVADIPAGRSVARENVASPIGGALQRLRFEDVLAADAIDFTAGELTGVVFSTFDGLQIDVDVVAQDEKYYARLTPTYDIFLAQRFAPPAQPAEGEADEAVEEAGEDDGAVASEEDLSQPEIDADAGREEAATLAAALSPWVFQIPEHKYTQLTKRMDDLLAAEP